MRSEFLWGPLQEKNVPWILGRLKEISETKPTDPELSDVKNLSEILSTKFGKYVSTLNHIRLDLDPESKTTRTLLGDHLLESHITWPVNTKEPIDSMGEIKRALMLSHSLKLCLIIDLGQHKGYIDPTGVSFESTDY